MAPRVFYIGVSVGNLVCLQFKADILFQILRIAPNPVKELAVEKDLSSYSRFTREKSVSSHISQFDPED